jgi:hypothetical protein
MKAVNIFFIVLFVFSAALQYNDPDPYVWMPIYLFGAYLCYQAIKGRYNPIFYLIGLVVYFSYAVYLFVDKTGVLDWINQHHAENILQSMKATTPWIEETRECMGLCILIVALILNMVWISRRKKPRAA